MSTNIEKGALYGLMVEFDDVPNLVHAVEKCRDQGFKNWDVQTPFPVHGMDEAMGIKGSLCLAFLRIFPSCLS